MAEIKRSTPAPKSADKPIDLEALISGIENKLAHCTTMGQACALKATKRMMRCSARAAAFAK